MGAPVRAADLRAARAAMLDGGDPLGDAFLAARSPERRRRDGAFYTGAPIRRAMLEWALQFRLDRLVDPGCGSGRFTADALRARPRLHVVAVDADPVATIMTRAVVATLRAPNARVVCGDYLSLSLDALAGRTAFVGNPPYVRHHELAAPLKRAAMQLAREAGLRPSGLSGLHAWFYVVTLLRHGVRGDVGALITSAQWLDASYGSIVRELLTGTLGGRSLLSFDASSSPFDAMTTAAIATFEIGRPVEAMSLGTLDDARDRFHLERSGRTVRVDRLRASSHWSELFCGGADDRAQRSTIGSSFRVSRGQVTGANDFFVLTRERATALGVADFCVPVLSRANEVLASERSVVDSPRRRVALSVPPRTDLAENPALARYLADGEARGVHLGYVASRRKPWYSIEYPRPPIVATYMARRAPHFACNPDGLGILNVLHGLYPRQASDAESLSRTVALLNAGGAAFERRGRTYHGGLRKFEPSDLAAVPFTASLRNQ